MSVVERTPKGATLWSGPNPVFARPLGHDPLCALLVISGSHQPQMPLPPVEVAQQWLHTLAESGFHRIRSNAVGEAARELLAQAGCVVAQDLMLLSLTHGTKTANFIHKSTPAVTVESVATWKVRWRPSNQEKILTLDTQAFGSEWRMDEGLFHDALTATERSKIFVVTSQGQLHGFAIMGAAAGTGYLQRLAVRQECRGQGIGATLVDNAVRWAITKGCRQTVVNTETINHPAQRLYEKIGFVPLPNRLTVLRKELR